MSRSYKKTPIVGNTISESEASDKKTWHRRWRKKIHDIFNKYKNSPEELDDVIFPEEDDVSSTWEFSKDGKHYMKSLTDEEIKKELRK